MTCAAITPITSPHRAAPLLPESGDLSGMAVGLSAPGYVSPAAAVIHTAQTTAAGQSWTHVTRHRRRRRPSVRPCAAAETSGRSARAVRRAAADCPAVRRPMPPPPPLPPLRDRSARKTATTAGIERSDCDATSATTGRTGRRSCGKTGGRADGRTDGRAGGRAARRAGLTDGETDTPREEKQNSQRNRTVTFELAERDRSGANPSLNRTSASVCA